MGSPILRKEMLTWLNVAVFGLVVQVCNGAGVWPQPAVITYSDNTSLPLSQNFDFVSAGPSSPIVEEAFSRYKSILGNNTRNTGMPASMAPMELQSLSVSVVEVTAPLDFGVNESYTLTIADGKATLTAQTPFGALRGLETFVQLAEHDNTYSPGKPAVPSAG